jgi:hypothetical protein
MLPCRPDAIHQISGGGGRGAILAAPHGREPPAAAAATPGRTARSRRQNENRQSMARRPRPWSGGMVTNSLVGRSAPGRRLCWRPVSGDPGNRYPYPIGPVLGMGITSEFCEPV